MISIESVQTDFHGTQHIRSHVTQLLPALVIWIVRRVTFFNDRTECFLAISCIICLVPADHGAVAIYVQITALTVI